MRARAFAAALLLLLGAGTARAAKAKDRPSAAKRPQPLAMSTAPARLLPLLAPATGEITVPLVIERLEAYDRTLDSLAADFRQTVHWDESGVRQAVEGTLEYKKPDLLRIEHRVPQSQTIVADGIWLWIWRPENNQVIQTRFEQWKKSEPAAARLLDFGKYGELLKRYEVSIGTVSDSDSQGHRDFEVLLKPGAQDKDLDFLLRLHLSTRDFFPADTELKVGQVQIHSVFTNIRFNPGPAAERFRFSPPPGADVFDNFHPPSTGQP